MEKLTGEYHFHNELLRTDGIFRLDILESNFSKD